MENKFQKRKPMRLYGFDYSMNGSYFITVCTKDRRALFGPLGARTAAARMVERTFLETVNRYEGIATPIYVVMPNHFHAIITVARADTGSAPTVSEVVQSFKRHSTVAYGGLVKEGLALPYEKQLWQRSFYDHIIRNDDDYFETYKYIEENPLQWQLDKLYTEG